MNLTSLMVLLLLTLLSEVSVAGPFCRGKKSSSSSGQYYRPTVVYEYEIPGRRIDYDVTPARTSNDFGNYDGQIVNDRSGTWKWDASGQIWRGPVTETWYYSKNNGPWVPVGSTQYWRK